MKINQIKELLSKNLVRKNVDVKSISFDKLENASGGNIKTSSYFESRDKQRE